MGLRAAQNGALRRPVKETQPGCQTASRTRLGFRNANCGSRRELNGKLARARAAASAATRSGANRPWPPDWSDEAKSGAGPWGTGGVGLGRGVAAGALPEDFRALRAIELTPSVARDVDPAVDANPGCGNVPGPPASVPGRRAGAERTRAGAEGPGDVKRRGAVLVLGADAGGGVADETPAAARTGATASLTTAAVVEAAAGLDGGATGGELVAAAVAAVARSDAEETAANARSTAGCVAAAASGETALICATAELMVADTSAAPDVVPAAWAIPGAASAPHTAANSTQTRGENRLPTGFSGEIVQPLVIARLAPAMRARR